MTAGTRLPIVDANGNPVTVPDNVVPSDELRLWMAGRVPVACGHYIAKSEADAGLTSCERCG